MKAFIINHYLRWPLLFDAVVAIALGLGAAKYLMPCIIIDYTEKLLDVIFSIIGTCVSLAGFILAALTIIVTFKSNLKAKGIAESNDALELILSSKHYGSIVSVFKTAIIEFIVVAITLYLVAALSWVFSTSNLLIVTIVSIIISSLTIWRSLFMLFAILNLEKKDRSTKQS